jgi:hypothetical protein
LHTGSECDKIKTTRGVIGMEEIMATLCRGKRLSSQSLAGLAVYFSQKMAQLLASHCNF